MKRKLILNPKAGSGRAARGLARLRGKLEAMGEKVDLVFPESRESAIEETRRALQAGYDQLIVMGGDGTLNAVANGFFESGKLLNPQACILPAPSGTGNDYAQAVLGETPWLDLVERSRPVPVDVGVIEGLDGKDSPRLFLNIGSLGMSADVVLKQRSLPRLLPGIAAYALPTLHSVCSFSPLSMTVRLDGQEIRDRFLNVFFAKGETVGGGMRLGGHVGWDDGELDVTLVHGMGLRERLGRLHKLRTGEFQSDPRFTKTRARVVEILTEAPLPVEFDGEILGAAPIRVTVRSRAVPICFPLAD